MSENLTLVKYALIIMVFGMGFVFTFLGIQVIMTNWMAKFAAKYPHLLPEPEKPAKKAPAKKNPAAAPAQDGELVAVISAAIQQHAARQ